MPLTQFHNLSHEEFRGTIVSLTKSLMSAGMNTMVTPDHFKLWSWCGEILLAGEGPLSFNVDPKVYELANLTVRAALAPTAYSNDQLPSESPSILLHSALPYLAFPLLEAVCRRACSQYVDLTGKVRISFARGSGQPYEVGQRCNSVADLLRLLDSSGADQDLASDLDAVLTHIESLPTAIPRRDGYDIVSEWRNSSLHGEVSLMTMGGTVLTLALMVALSGISADYDTHRGEAFRRAQRSAWLCEKSGDWSPTHWSYYLFATDEIAPPPEWG